MKIYAIRDKLSGYLFVLSCSNDEVAKRNFNLMYRPGTDSADDYELWVIGDWNTDSGKIKPCTPDFICRGIREIGVIENEVSDAV